MMGSYLVFTVRFLDGEFHGRADARAPEWPPSPLRMFQALVAAAARSRRLEEAEPALRWLEGLGTPRIVAPEVHLGPAVRIAVPNNDLDLVATAWAKGKDPSKAPSELKTMKTIQPHRLLGGDEVQYLWPFDEALGGSHPLLLTELARSVVALGWGIDVVIAHGLVVSHRDAPTAQGQVWNPVPDGSGAADLRVPVSGTLKALRDRHEAFLRRLGRGGYVPVAPLSMFNVVSYRIEGEPVRRPVVAFALVDPGVGVMKSFDPVRRGLALAGMVRHATRRAAVASGWPDRKIDGFVLGHGGPDKASPAGPDRFAFLPLPSIEARGHGGAMVVGRIRRILLASYGDGTDGEVAWARSAVSGLELIDENLREAVALMAPLSTSEAMVQRYTRPATTWATVTPVVLPGHEDPGGYRRRLAGAQRVVDRARLIRRLDERIDQLLRKAIVQAGFSPLLAQHAELEFRRVAFVSGADLADRYGVPDHLRRLTRLHVKVRWREPTGGPLRVPGPICLGGGRFYGVGLFMAVDDVDRSP